MRLMMPAAALLAAMSFSPAAGAQTVDPKACAPGERATLGSGATGQPQTPQAGANDNLSDKLARTDGVICPPANIDPRNSRARARRWPYAGHTATGAGGTEGVAPQ